VVLIQEVLLRKKPVSATAKPVGSVSPPIMIIILHCILGKKGVIIAIISFSKKVDGSNKNNNREAIVYHESFLQTFIIAFCENLQNVKGTVSRNFLTLFFFIKQFLLVLLDMPRRDFNIFLVFKELFVCVINSSVMNTP
jgi:hypothetical protein